MMLRRLNTFGKRFAIGFIGLLFFIGLFSLLPIRPKANLNIQSGFTFSIHAVNALNMDWREVYAASLQELRPKVIRIPVYWDIIEPQPHAYDWQAFDAMLDQARQAEARVILAIGHKLPRWPECHLPPWFKDLPEEQTEAKVLSMLRAVVERYKPHPAVIAWQVENEALFYFGECPDWSRDRDRLRREIELVQSLDDRPVMTSDSGELSLWLRTSTLPVDALSISLYRTVYKAGYRDWPVNPFYYQWRRWLISPFVQHLVVSELQMEPWGPKPVQELSPEDVEQSFPPQEFSERFDFAARTGAETVIAWGVEWWYYMKQQRGDSRYWQAAKDYFSRP